ncbi:YEATS2 family protein [Megaselia abdita]
MSISHPARTRSEKRSLPIIDPDYTTIKSESTRFSKKQKQMNKHEVVSGIINKEYDQEIRDKEDQVNKIDNRIRETKLLLHQLRYSIVTDYYQKKYSDGIGEEDSNWLTDPNKTDQPIVSHPAVKNLRNKESNVLNTPKVCNDLVQEKLSPRTKNIDVNVNNVPSSSKLIYPGNHKSKKEITTLNAARCSNQSKHLIVVGNTSKFIGMENPSDSTTHKWLIYVQSKSGTSIEKIVSKVRFLLHSSYSPNDIVDIECPPFQLARRGWGEFPVRIQLFFHSNLHQKPLHFVHNLILDKTLTGLQTMGAETLVEVWLRDNRPKDYTTSLRSSNTPGTCITANEGLPLDTTNFLDRIGNKIESSVLDSQSQPTVRLKNDKVSTSKQIETTKNIRSPPVVQQENSHINQPEAHLVFQSLKERVLNKVDDKPKISLLQKHRKYAPHNKHLKQKSQKDYIKKFPDKASEKVLQKKVFQKDGKMYIIDPLQTKLRKQSLLKPQVSLLRSQLPVSLIRSKSKQINLLHGDHDYIKLKSFEEIVVKKVPSQNFSKELELKFLSIKFATLRHAIDFLLRKLPLVSRMANDTNFKNCYPFIVSNLDEYHKIGKVKQFTYEWLRAKYIKKCISSHINFGNDAWTTKEIFIYARKHAFLPVIQNCDDSDVESLSPPLSNLSSIVRSAIKHDSYSIKTLSLCHKVYDFIYSVDSKIDKSYQESYNKIIDVDNMSSKNGVETKLETNILDKTKQQTLFMGIHENLETESLLVSSFAQDIGIRLENEIIGNNVLYPACLTILSQSLRLFLNDLLRRSLTESNHNRHEIQVIDILKAINSTPKFDFITNRNLGIVNAKSDPNV